MYKMRKTKYVSGYGYITQNGGGFWLDAGKEVVTNIGKRVASAIGDRIGSKIAKKIVGRPQPIASKSRESVLKELELLPKEYGLSEDVRKALYGSGSSKRKYLI